MAVARDSENKSFYGDYGSGGDVMTFQSNLEKVAMAVRDATKTVQYYSPNYDYRSVVYTNNDTIKTMFEYNELGR